LRRSINRAGTTDTQKRADDGEEHGSDEHRATHRVAATVWIGRREKPHGPDKQKRDKREIRDGDDGEEPTLTSASVERLRPRASVRVGENRGSRLRQCSGGSPEEDVSVDRVTCYAFVIGIVLLPILIANKTRQTISADRRSVPLDAAS